METKKSYQANLENKKVRFFEIGLVLVLAAVLVAFEWSTSAIEIDDLIPAKQVLIDSEIIPITRMKEKPKPLPPVKKQLPPPVDFKVVDNTEKIKEDIVLASTEFTEDAFKIDFDMYDDEDEVIIEPQIFDRVEEMPEFPGGEKMLLKFIADNVDYSMTAQDMGIEGRVIVQFVVSEDGSIENVAIARGVDPLVDQASIDVIKSLPRWKPGKQRNKPVKVKYTVPIVFKIIR